MGRGGRIASRGLPLLFLLLARAALAVGTCASATTIAAGGGTVTAVTSGSSALAGSCGSSGSAPEWVYQWTPAASGVATIQTCGTGTNFDTVLYMREAVNCLAGPDLACTGTGCTLSRACNDDACANASGLVRASKLSPTVTAGVTYDIIVDGYGTAQGAFSLSVTPPAGPTTTAAPTTTTTTTTTSTTTTTGTPTTTTTGAPTTTTSTTTTTTTSTTTTTISTTTTTTSTTTSTTSTTLMGSCGTPRLLPAAGGTVTGVTSGVSHTSSNCGSTATSPEAVFTWTPLTSGTWTLQTCGTSTAFDTVLYVRTAATCAAGGDLALCGTGTGPCCNDDACANASGLNRASRLTIAVTAGQTYYVIVDGYGGTMGNYALTATFVAPPTTTTTLAPTTTTSTTTTSTTSTTTTTGAPTTTTTTTAGPTTTTTSTTATTTTSTTTTTLNACSLTTTIAAGGGTFLGTTSGGSTLGGSCGSSGASPEKVYQWTPTQSGPWTIQTCGGQTGYDTVVYLRQSPCLSGAEVACNDDAPCACATDCVAKPNAASRITPTVTSGQTYFIVVDGFTGASGPFTLSVAPVTTTTTSPGATTTTTLPPLALTGFVPGIASSSDAVVDGTTHRAYVASKQFGLSVVDVTTPASPVVIGAANPPFYGARVSRIGTRAVVTASGLGLRVVNLTDETHPVTVGTLAGTYSAVVMKDANTAYATALVANVGVFQVVNVGVTPPVVTTSLALTAAGDFKVVGGLAYIPSVIGGQAALKIVNPATTPPTLVGQVGGMPNSFALDVAVSGTTAYVAMGFAGIQVVNVSDTAHPTLGTVLGESASALVTSGTRLYAVDGSLLKLIDISTPGTPALIGSGAAYGGQRVAVDGATAYLTAGTGAGAGLSIQTVSGSAPVLVTNVADAVNNLGVAVSGTRAVEAGGVSGMKALSVATPGAPTVGGTFASFAGCVALSGTTAYAFDANTGLLKVIDVSGTPTLSGSTSIGACGDMQVVGTTLYVASGGFGLRLVNVATPSSPAVTGTANTPGTALGVAVLGSYAYVADTTTIQVVDVSDPNNPVIVNSVPTAATAVSALGNRLYAVTNGSVKILSLATPSAPSILNAGVPYDGVQGVVADPGRPNVIYLAGPALNHGDTPPGIYEGIIALNVANAAAPVQLGSNLVTPGTVKKLAFANGLIYASDSAGIVDVVTP